MESSKTLARNFATENEGPQFASERLAEATADNLVRAAARRYRQRGYSPIPVSSRQKAPTIPAWQKLRLTEDEIDVQFSDPASNVGILLGEASQNLADVDQDCREAVILAPYLLPRTGMIHGRASNRSSHRWYKVTGVVQTKAYKFPDKRTGEKSVLVELRSNGAQTIVPPSVHPSGERLEWEEDGEPGVVAAEELSEAVAQLAAAALIVRHWPAPGSRQDAALALAGLLRREGWDVTAIERFVEAVAVAAGDEESAKRVDAVARTAEALDRGNQVTGGTTLASVLRDGEAVVRKVRLWLFNPFSIPPAEAKSQVFELTDLGNAERLVTAYGNDLRYVAGVGWYVWDGKRWQKDALKRIYTFAERTARDIRAEGERVEKESVQNAMRRWGRESESAARITALVKLAQAPLPNCPVITVNPDDLDKDPLLLNVNNGTLDLRTGTLLPFDRQQLITKLAPVDYYPAAECPTWLSFLNLVFDNDQELIGFVQRAIGYTLTGLVVEQAVFFPYGTGQNGKSTLLNILLKLMGDYGKPSAPDLLLVKRNEAHPTELADLCGVRLVTTIEVEEGRQLAESMVKWLTGGDRLKARFMRQDFFEFAPTHKIWLAANHRPIVRGTDYAIWRRIYMLPFTVKLSDRVIPDPFFSAKLEAEMPGILRWCVEGALAYQRVGLNPPAQVQQATKDYQDDMDTIGRFLTEQCRMAPDARIDATTLYQGYKYWAEQNGEPVLTRRRFNDYLRGRGLESRRSGPTGGTEWYGVGLASGAAGAKW